MKTLKLFISLIALFWASPAFAQVTPALLKEVLYMAERGDIEAQLDLASRYFNGHGVKKDFKKAADWCRKAAEQGDAEAQFNLGVHYANGVGVKQDYFKAVEWYQKAAEQGQANAQFNLGLMYSGLAYEGQSVIREDRKNGCRLLRSSAKQGHRNAIETYNEFCADGNEKNKEQAEINRLKDTMTKFMTSDLERMKTISPTFDSDYETLHGKK
jgi:TPR repeat protein